ncbi:AraC family transcriptional regulator [Mariniblastus fucicola]|uniref:Xylose operon regulatory protein n=1 Tax=Mariniblastus fucicola TaxID=980251 RepID=A0A5B9PKD6_9BACT|nr:AraC family transcriptional regulator [Mariniblastus fucicola]QEG22883.1 Xylose operon regulatory protein [Mariniblastus fucicola]
MADSDSSTFNYLPVPEIVNRLGLYVTGAGTDIVPAGAAYPRQNHPELYHFSWHAGRVLPEFQFVFVAAGRGEFESRETGLQEIKPGTIMMLFPDVWHRYRPHPGTGWTEYWISLGGDLLFQWLGRGLFDPNRPLTTLRQPGKTIEKYEDVIDFVMSRPEQDAPMLTAHAMALIASALEQAQTSVESINSKDDLDRSDNPLVTEALRVIWNNSHQRVSVDMIAKQLGVTRRTLERHFKKHLGRTLLQELVACRIQRAKRLLRETHVPIKYVAHAAGFSSLPNLCKVFRREVGTTPGSYREAAAMKQSARRWPNSSAAAAPEDVAEVSQNGT